MSTTPLQTAPPETAPRLPADMATPAFVIDIARLKANLALADRVRREAGARVLLATKAFAMPAVFPCMRDHLDGTTASGEYEARLGREAFGKEVHCYSPAYTPSEMAQVCAVADHVYLNSAEQYARFGAQVKAAGKHVGIRINPGYSNATLGGALYDPCAPGSRFGAVGEEIAGIDWSGVDLLHAHALCESLHDGSVGLINHIARKFGDQIRQVKAVNFGGGHFLGKPGYNVDALIAALSAFRREFGVDTYIEPGGGLVVNAGWLVSEVVALHRNGGDLAIMDASASCHMPDVLEVPYRPHIVGAGDPGEHPYTYTLGGKTCMTGDIIGQYSFPRPLEPGDRLVFADMAHYTLVKTNTFNGAPLPDLGILDEAGNYRVVARFGYEAFRSRLG